LPQTVVGPCVHFLGHAPPPLCGPIGCCLLLSVPPPLAGARARPSCSRELCAATHGHRRPTQRRPVMQIIIWLGPVGSDTGHAPARSTPTSVARWASSADAARPSTAGRPAENATSDSERGTAECGLHNTPDFRTPDFRTPDFRTPGPTPDRPAARRHRRGIAIPAGRPRPGGRRTAPVGTPCAPRARRRPPTARP
jgi:hypothetical protein